MPAHIFESVINLGNLDLRSAQDEIKTLKGLGKDPKNLENARKYWQTCRGWKGNHLSRYAEVKAVEAAASTFMILGIVELHDASSHSFAAKWSVLHDDESSDVFNGLVHADGVPEELTIDDELFLTLGTQLAEKGLFRLRTLVTTEPLPVKVAETQQKMLESEPYQPEAALTIVALSNFMASLRQPAV